MEGCRAGSFTLIPVDDYTRKYYTSRTTSTHEYITRENITRPGCGVAGECIVAVYIPQMVRKRTSLKPAGAGDFKQSIFLPGSFDGSYLLCKVAVVLRTLETVKTL